MKKLALNILIIALFVFQANAQFSRHQTTKKGAEDDKTLSPYFLVKSDDPDTDQLPLLSTSADVKIAGVIADVTVKQIYKNDGKNPLEALYVFPASTKAAVYGMTMTIGDRILKAEIQEKAKARETYEKAKEEGKSASLLEQRRPNVFQMNVANIMPGDSIVVELKYTELLVPREKVYKFVYPTVVGPRYSNTPKSEAKDDEKFVESPYHKKGEKPSYTFDIDIELTTGIPPATIECPTHKVEIDKEEKQTFIELSDEEKNSGNRDFILRYSLSGDNIQTGLLLSEYEDEKFFLLMLQPPKRIQPKNIPPREYVFIVDVSGSMRGFPLGVSKDMMLELFKKLRPNDKFNIIFFAGGSKILFEESKEATPENIAAAEKMLKEAKGSGGTELLPALKRAMSSPKPEGLSRSFVILTDGYVTVEEETFDLIRKGLDEANFFSFGIGSGVNRYLIKGIAKAGMGEPFVVTNSEEAAKKSERFIEYVSSPIMTDIEFELDGFDAYAVEPVEIPDVFAERPIIIYGKWRGAPEGKIIVSGMYKNKRYAVKIDLRKFGVKTRSAALKYLWARKKIEIMSDYSSVSVEEKYKEEITNLALKYNLLSKYTSFVAVDYIKRRDGSDSLVSVKQPLPLPEGVEDEAVGGRGGTMAASRMSVGGRGAPIKLSHSHNALQSFSEKHKNKSVSDISIDTLSAKDKKGITSIQPPSCDLKELKQNVDYPEEARIEGIEGKVMVKAQVDTNGNVVRTEIIQSDNDIFNSAAIVAVKKTKFKPGTQGGVPVKSWVYIPIKFNLEYEIEDVKEGGGNEAKPLNKVEYAYKIKDSDGNIIYSKGTKNNPKTRLITVDVIDAWISGMKKGGIREVTASVEYVKEVLNISKDLDCEGKVTVVIELIDIVG